MDILENALKALVGKDAVYFALLALGLNIQFGYAGLLNFGQAGFALLGAYGVAITVTQWGGSYWLGIGVSLIAAVGLALLLGAPTLRLRADYLAIATIAATEILRLVIRSPSSEELTGSTQGLSGFAGTFYNFNPFEASRYDLLGVRFSGQELWILLVGWLVVLLLVLALWIAARSPWGRLLKAIREDEDAARSLGKNVYWYKMQALIAGGILGALAGVFQATAVQSVEPDTYDSQITFYAYAALILGGTATAFGPVLGAMLLWVTFSLTDTVLRELSGGENPIISPDFLSSQGISAVRFILAGLALMLLMTLRPQGILGNRTEVRLGAK